MFRALCLCCLLAGLALAGCAASPTGPAGSNLTVRMTGDAQVYGVYRSSGNFTGWR